MKHIQKEKIGKYIIKIYNDDPIDPRGNDNLGTMVCFHTRYSLGDKHNYNHKDYKDWEQMKKAIIRNENAGVILPLYLYDHSGITMNTTGFSCRWDSGQVGWIYISKQKMLEEYGGKYVTKKLKERVAEYLVNEVEEYDQYLTGEAYGYKIFKKGKNGKKEEFDSCWGYNEQEYCLSEARGVVAYYVENNKEKIDV